MSYRTTLADKTYAQISTATAMEQAELLLQKEAERFLGGGTWHVGFIDWQLKLGVLTNIRQEDWVRMYRLVQLVYTLQGE